MADFLDSTKEGDDSDIMITKLINRLIEWAKNEGLSHDQIVRMINYITRN